MISVDICNTQAETNPEVNFYIGATGNNPLVGGPPSISGANLTNFGPNNVFAIGTVNIGVDEENFNLCQTIEIAYPMDPEFSSQGIQQFVMTAWNDNNSDCIPIQVPECPSTDPDCIECSGPLCDNVCGPLVAFDVEIYFNESYTSNEDDNTISEIFANQVGDNENPTDPTTLYSYRIEEDLTVDTDWFEIGNPGSPPSGILFDPGKRIIIQDGVHARFEYYNFKSCSDIFWDAIEVMPGGKLTMINCNIKQGHNAIRAHEGAILDIRSCDFIDNYTSVSLLGEVNPTYPIEPFIITFYDNYIAGSGSLADPYPGQVLASNDLPYAGIELFHVSFADLAAPDPTDNPTLNTFDNMHNGIVSRASSFIVKEAQFTNMLEIANSDDNTISGYGIFANNARSRKFNFMRLLDSSAESLFINMNTGIYVRNMDGIIDDAIMYSIKKGIEVRECVNNNFIIQNCTIDPTTFGIYTVNNTPLFGVMRDNNITIDATNINPTAAIVSGGIVCSENVSTSNGWIIRENDIDLIKADVGLYYSNGGGANISENRILKADGEKNRTFRLAQVINSPNTGINCNFLTNLDQSGNFTESIGLDVTDSPMMGISCNDISFVEKGVSFDGPCEGTNFKSNNIANGFVGLSLSSTAAISQQAHKGNCFNNNQNAEAIHNSNDEDFIGRSLFTVKCGQEQTGSSCICPDYADIFTGTNDPTDFFKQEPFGDTEQCDSDGQLCAEFERRPIGGIMEDKISQDISTDQSVYASQANFERMMQYNLFSALDNSDVNVTGTIYESFYNNALQSDLNSIAIATKTLDRPSDQFTVRASLQSKLHELRDLEQGFYGGQISEATYQQNRNNLSDELNTILESINNTELAYQEDLEEYFENQQLQILSMTGSNVYDANMKWILEKTIQFKLQNNSDFDDGTWHSIYNLAKQCTKDAGHAVYLARTLYHQKAWVDFNEDQDCNFTAERAHDRDDFADNSKHLLYPNPASDQITIEWTKNNKATLNIVDPQGKVILSTGIQKGENSIVTDNLPPGVYFYDIFDDSQENHQGKFIILNK